MVISSIIELNTCETAPAETQKRDKREAIRMSLKAKGLNPLCCPKWLKDLSVADIKEGKLPLLKILKGSLYYPACNDDGGPIIYFGQYVHSFVYADYKVEKDKIMESLKSFNKGGYDLLGLRNLTESDLTLNRWRPQHEFRGLRYNRWQIEPPSFVFWAVFERQAKYDEDYGADRFSLLYIGGEGVATYQDIFYRNETFPDWIAIIQPGGLNWTNFRDQDGDLGKAVLQNPYGKPKYLLYGGFGTGYPYNKPCWRRYNQFIYTICPYYTKYRERPSGEVGLWGMKKKKGSNIDKLLYKIIFQKEG